MIYKIYLHELELLRRKTEFYLKKNVTYNQFIILCETYLDINKLFTNFKN